MEQRKNVQYGANSFAEELDRLRRFDGPPGRFWPAFLSCTGRACGATAGYLMVRGTGWNVWKSMHGWMAGSSGAHEEAVPGAEKIAADSVLNGYAVRQLEDQGATLVGVRLDLEAGQPPSVLVFVLNPRFARKPEEVAAWLRQLSDIPARYHLRRVVDQARKDVVQFADVLDLMILLNEDGNYMKAAMTFCNELASRFHCERVSLGLLKDRYVRVQAISHMEAFEKKMDIVQSLETAMEECFDQDEEIVWPKPDGVDSVVREHERYTQKQGGAAMVSLPLRLDGESVGVLSCERGGEPFTEHEVIGLRLFCDQAIRRLSDLKKADRWFGARMASAARERFASLLGVEHTFAKLAGLLVCVALGVLLFGSWEYRVEAPFMLKTDAVRYVPAPFDGYIDKTHVRVGDKVDERDLLLSLDTRELLLAESSAVADRSRHAREAEKARAKNAFCRHENRPGAGGPSQSPAGPGPLPSGSCQSAISLCRYRGGRGPDPAAGGAGPQRRNAVQNRPDREHVRGDRSGRKGCA